MSDKRVAAGMREAAAALVAELDEQQRAQACLPFADETARRWIEYRPEIRPGTRLAGMSTPARKAAHCLLATVLSERAFAQAMAIAGLEEVLDRQEERRLRRHSNDYWLAVFGDPAAGNPWSWRFEGHHVSVSVTVQGDEVSPTPVFLGANPARVGFGALTVSRPLGPEEDLGRALLSSLSPAGRAVAVVADNAPGDIRTGVQPRAQAELEPLGIPGSALGPTARALLSQLVALYLDRLVPDLAAAQAAAITPGELYFAWEGPASPGTRHYYRVQGPDLLIEYDNTTADGNHAHTVLRRPEADFGEDFRSGRLGHPAAERS